MKHDSRRTVLVLVAALGAAGCSGSASDPSPQATATLHRGATCYAMTDLASPPAGDTFALAYAINDAGQILFGSGIGNHNARRHFFLWEDGETTPLPLFAAALNDRGQVVGNTLAPPLRPIRWRDGHSKDLGTLGGPEGGAVDINGRGWVAGNAQTANGDDHAFFWMHGDPVDLGTLGGTMSHALHINARGLVVGVSQTAEGHLHGFVWKHGEMIDVGTLGGASSTAQLVNRRGQVVGSSQTADGHTHKFLWERGEMTDLGPYLLEVNAMNDDGQLVGTQQLGATQPGHGVVWEDGEVTDLGEGLAPLAINNRGQVVGLAPTLTGSRAFVWAHGVTTYFADGSNALAINDEGQIVGSIGTHAALWDPIDCDEEAQR